MLSAEQLKQAVLDKQESRAMTSFQRCLWLIGVNRWDDAHDLCQELPDPHGAWIHAYLHRQEGDLSNAYYWYSRAGREMPSGDLHQEWGTMVEILSNAASF